MNFYFTGTGNSLYVAKQLDKDYRSIPQILRQGELAFSAKRIGIVCPIYGHEMPQMVKAFLKNAVFHTDYLYLVLTYGKRHGGAAELARNKKVDEQVASIRADIEGKKCAVQPASAQDRTADERAKPKGALS